MKAIPIKNFKIIQRLDKIGEDLYGLPHKWKHHPLPKTTVADLRNKMDNSNFSGHPELSNSIDYVGRAVSRNFTARNQALIGAIKELTSNDKWYWDTCLLYTSPSPRD